METKQRGLLWGLYFLFIELPATLLLLNAQILLTGVRAYAANALQHIRNQVRYKIHLQQGGIRGKQHLAKPARASQ